MTQPSAHPPKSDAAAQASERFHPETVARVRQAVADHPVVVVGMGWNIFVKQARRALEEAGIAYHYAELGNYLGQWPQRLAVKLWSGWPTFPQVFVNGTLLGGSEQTRAALADGSLAERLDG